MNQLNSQDGYKKCCHCTDSCVCYFCKCFANGKHCGNECECNNKTGDASINVESIKVIENTYQSIEMYQDIDITFEDYFGYKITATRLK